MKTLTIRVLGVQLSEPHAKFKNKKERGATAMPVHIPVQFAADKTEQVEVRHR